MVTSWVFAFALSFMMGLVIQRGGTCTVAAIHELVHKKSSDRIRALLETALWVLAGEFILAGIGLTMPPVSNWQITIMTMIGAGMLGIGALINGACAVGTIARIGNQEWNFFVMIPGFFTGAALTGLLQLPDFQPIHLGTQAAPLLPLWALILMSVLLILRAWSFYRRGFHPYVLTVLIGVFFLGLISIDKVWSYTDLLVDLAMFHNSNSVFRISLFAALLLGAIVSGRFQDKKDRVLSIQKFNLWKRFIGGAVMGSATLILPGSHDSLILLYMPMLLGYAWLGFVVMVSTILGAKLIIQRLEKTRY